MAPRSPHLKEQQAQEHEYRAQPQEQDDLVDVLDGHRSHGLARCSPASIETAGGVAATLRRSAAIHLPAS